jgi:hypothetical protein
MSRISLLFCAALCLNATVASAQSTEAVIETFDPSAAVAPISVVEGPGVKIGEGTVLQPVFGLETGYVTNTFYEQSDENAAGILRLLAQIGVGSLSKQRLDPADAEDETGGGEGSLRYRASLRASYDLMLSDDDTVTETGGLGIGFNFNGIVNPRGNWAFRVDEDFNRLIRAANFETDANTNRDINNLRLGLRFQPVGRTMSGELYYGNTLDYFEREEQEFANRLQHRFGFRYAWTWRPRTQFYADTSLGYYTGLGDSQKVTSYPLVAKVGVATLFTPLTSLNLEAGYTNGFYSEGPSFSAPMVNAQFGYRYSPLGRIAFIYSLEYADSINANYYRDHVLRVWLRQSLRPFTFMVQPEVHFRQYNGIMLVPGPTSRDDVIVSVVAGATYSFRNWIAATLNYRFTSVSTDYLDMSSTPPDDPSYARHELLLGMRVAL